MSLISTQPPERERERERENEIEDRRGEGMILLEDPLRVRTEKVRACALECTAARRHRAHVLGKKRREEGGRERKNAEDR